jgi:hypothetical protein
MKGFGAAAAMKQSLFQRRRFTKSSHGASKLVCSARQWFAGIIDDVIVVCDARSITNCFGARGLRGGRPRRRIR